MDEKMMKEYIFYDSYDWDNCGIEEEYDIKGKDYKKLITRLFKYSSCFSLCFNAPEHSQTRYPTGSKPIRRENDYGYDNRNDYPEYDKYIIKKAVQGTTPPKDFDFLGTFIAYEWRFYRCCDETLKFLLAKFDSIYSFVPWCNNNPEDPYFYRSDGSVLFASLTHEGECYLLPHDGEDFSNILTTPPWCTTEISEDLYYRRFCKFAHEHMSIEEFNV
ncbi:MAG: hypothetical protein E7578_04670 [Ruminococcaceae bacterium]|nr:hypothetical protein [Oscillospiraceae bacterium]